MQVILLGGASGIGASCVAVEVGAHWIVIDAGIRMDPNADRLPDLAFLQHKDVAAIFVTHAHADHIGALPLVHQAFPLAPVYASRATMHLMEVMLADALNVMQKRASDVLEVPLYDKAMVSSLLQCLYPLPMTETVQIPELPDVVIHLARAGHVAGAVSIGIETPNGRVLISGDVSMTPQRTIPGAELPSLNHPDLLVLESTYGSRLHPNRQAEEDRLATAVAEGIERGHVLIPAFALGRAQEVLLILHDAQRRGRIPEFPIWVDGLVRTVCTAYTAIPEALTPALQRQIHKGYQPFFSGMVQSVANPKQRESILAGKPACIVTSSGMLTGGPSAFYASHLAEREDASILITGYQDEESPGRKLLDLADKGTGTLNINEKTVTVRCHFGRYSLSAHADGSELTAFVGQLKPAQVVLVHGDIEARTALAQRMQRLTDVRMPEDGTTLQVETRRQRRMAKGATTQSHRLAALGNGQPLQVDDVPRLWQTVAHDESHMLSIRELALAWYGSAAGADEETVIQQVLAQNQTYFVPVLELPNIVRVRTSEEVGQTPEETSAGHALHPGALVLLRDTRSDKLNPAICIDTRSDVVWVYLPSKVGNRRRFPISTVADVLGRWPSYPFADGEAERQSLAQLAQAAKRWQRNHPMRPIALHMQPNQSYSLDDIAALVGVAPDDTAGRIGLAMRLNMHPDVIVRQQPDPLLRNAVWYRLHDDWETNLASTSDTGEMPNQTWIVSTIKEALGNPADLYRTSINPQTGDVTLYFHFPDVASKMHAEAIEAAAYETGVTITVAPNPHQEALTNAGHAVVPADLTVTKTSVHHDQRMLRMQCEGAAECAAIQHAQEQFAAKTGWRLELQTAATQQAQSGETEEVHRPNAHVEPLNQTKAADLARSLFDATTGCYKVSMDIQQHVLMLRFSFPDVVRNIYTEKLQTLAEQTGWKVMVYPEPNQKALEQAALELLPPSMVLAAKKPSLHRAEKHVIVSYIGEVDEQVRNTAAARFADKTGWQLLFKQRQL